MNYKDFALPSEIEILSKLPEEKRELVFNLVGKQNHCNNLNEWLLYLQWYVDQYCETDE
jgi:hypothetical protein